MMLIDFNNGIARGIFRDMVLHIGQHRKSSTGIAIRCRVPINRQHTSDF